MAQHDTYLTQVITEVCSTFGVTRDDLMGTSRVPRIRKARGVMYWILNQTLSMEAIAQRCNRKSDSSVHSSICTFLGDVRRDKQFREHTRTVLTKVGGDELRDRLLP